MNWELSDNCLWSTEPKSINYGELCSKSPDQDQEGEDKSDKVSKVDIE